MKRRVLVSAPYLQPVIEQFRTIFEQEGIELIIPQVNERLEEEELLAYITDIDGAICGDDRFTANVIAAAARLKVISKWGTGIDSIDLEACRQSGIQVCNTPNAFSIPVADSVIGYMLCFCRKLPWMDQEMRQGVWNKIPGRSLHECTLGVIGVGNVGKTLVQRARSFGMVVYGNDIVRPAQEFIDQNQIEMLSLKDLLQTSDFVSLNCDLNPTSFHLINRDRFTQMKPDGIVINTARGPVIKETDLVSALKDGTIAGAALDVFEQEPLSADSPLLQMKNVLLAPHNANSSPSAWEAVHHSTIKNLLDALTGGS